MEKLPEDIIKRIELDYKTKYLQNYVIKRLSSINSLTLNVGLDQFIRSILIISNGNINELNKILET
ncbi:MAG: hypothetical protein FWH29_09455 [Methanobrevibacter sp.]|nr:hypothetical protein [Methanobrevibacter sp.]